MPNLANLPVADLQAGTANWSGQGYIDGLKMQWVSATALTVSSGAAFIPALNKCLPVPAAIAKTGLSLTASTWYHVYLWLNAGVPDIEIVTTAPAAAYSGTARAKTGDTSRRYIGSVRTDASSNIYSFQHGPEAGLVLYQTNIGPAPFVVVNGNATTATNVSCSAVVPVTSTVAKLFVANNDTVNSVYLGNSAMPPTTGSFMAYVAISPSVYPVDMALDSSQQFQYLFTPGAPSANFVARVGGYYFER